MERLRLDRASWQGNLNLFADDCELASVSAHGATNFQRNDFVHGQVKCKFVGSSELGAFCNVVGDANLLAPLEGAYVGAIPLLEQGQQG